MNIDGPQSGDVFVRWRTARFATDDRGLQDLSGTCLSHRIDKSENKVMVRLTIADLVDGLGILRSFGFG